MTIGLLLLAAGRSRRFKAEQKGVHKLLYRDASYSGSILERTYGQAHKVFDCREICIVVNTQEPSVIAHARQLGSPILTIQSQGIGESISQAVEMHQSWDGLLILHADLPLIQKETIEMVRKAVECHPIVRPVYQNISGHPVGFQPMIYPQLMALSGDQGASQFIRKQMMTLIPVDDFGSIQDIDTPQDLIIY